MVDAELIEDQLIETEEAISQITFSDVLLINKTDLVSEKYLQELLNKLQKLNPLATIEIGNQNNFPELDAVNHNTQFDIAFDKKDHHKHPINDSIFPVQKPHTHHHHEHTENVVSLTLVFNQPFDYNLLNHRLMVYLMLQSKDLYRMKGLLWIKDSEKQYLLQSVGKRYAINEKRIWNSEETKQSKIVFIGKNIQKNALEKMLSQCIVK